MKTKNVRVFALLLGILTLSACASSNGVQPSAAIEPASLIGEYGGTWVQHHHVGVHGPFWVEIRWVDGSLVVGEAEIVQLYKTSCRFRGKFERETLVFGCVIAGTFTIFELKWDGRQFRGPSHGGTDWSHRDIVLNKRK
jgi:hypothetical protein